MILQTAQSLEAYENMCRTGVLKSDRKHIFDDSFLCAYKWMAEQLAQKVAQPTDGILLPVWAWYQWEGERYPNMKPFEDECFTRNPVAIITFEVPDKDVLLSDFDYWHFVLYDEAISDTEKECFVAEKEQSWQKIFDIARLSNDNSSIQAVLWKIEQKWITNVKITQKLSDVLYCNKELTEV